MKAKQTEIPQDQQEVNRAFSEFPYSGRGGLIYATQGKKLTYSDIASNLKLLSGMVYEGIATAGKISRRLHEVERDMRGLRRVFGTDKGDI